MSPVRALLLLLTTLLLATSTASAKEVALEVGGDLGLLFRDEAGGNRSVLPFLAPRASYGLTDAVRLAAVYAFSYAWAGGELAAASTQHHRLSLRGEFVLPVKRARFVVGAGPAAVFMHTTLYDRDTSLASTNILRFGAAGSAMLEVPLKEVTLRASTELLVAGFRYDVIVGLGASFDLGGRR